MIIKVFLIARRRHIYSEGNMGTIYVDVNVDTIDGSGIYGCIAATINKIGDRYTITSISYKHYYL